MRKDFYIFRHGQSTYNLSAKIQGRTNDSILTDFGKEQAKIVGEKLKNKGIEVIVSSPLTRAMETAELANLTIKKEIIKDSNFTEVDVGVVEGLDYIKAKEIYKDIFEKIHSKDVTNEDVSYPGGETRKHVRKRVFEGLEYWASKDEYKCVAISSHGIMLSQILLFFGEDVKNIPNGAILHIKKENSVWSLVEWV